MTVLSLSASIAAAKINSENVEPEPERSAGDRSPEVAVIASLAPPIAQPASEVNASHFVASWSSVAGASGYLLDVATNSAFRSSRAVWINELHYDNDGTDAVEGVEVAGFAGTSLNGYRLLAYNGQNGTVYQTLLLSGVVDNETGSAGAVWFPLSGLQNGAPDGVALIAPDASVVQFISYEGSFVAVEGEASGETSQDIGLSEEASTLGESLQLVGAGGDYADFAWSGPVPHSPGSLNAGQTVTVLPSDFVVGYESLDVGSVVTQRVSGLDADTGYYYRARAYESAGSVSENSNTQWVQTTTGPAPEIDVLNTDQSVEYGVFSIDLTGSCTNISGDLSWTNALTADHGTITAAAAWSITKLPLGVGENTITVSGRGEGETCSDALTIVRLMIKAPVSPIFTYTNSTELTASWPAVAGASNYLVDVSTSPTFTQYGVPGTNRMSNGGFEDGDNTDWSLFEPEYAVISEGSMEGTYCVRCDATGTRLLAQDVQIETADGNTAYEVSYWYRTVTAGSRVRTWSSWDNGDGTGDTLTPASYNPESTAWVKIAYTNMPPAGATSLHYEIRTYSSSSVYLDAFSVRMLGPQIPCYVKGYEDREVVESHTTVRGLDPEMQYFLRVSTQNGGDLSPESAVISSTTRTLSLRTLIVVR